MPDDPWKSRTGDDVRARVAEQIAAEEAPLSTSSFGRRAGWIAGLQTIAGDDEFADFVAVPQVLNEVPASTADESLLVAAESVEIIEDGVVVRFAAIVAGRKQDAVGNRVAENLAGSVAAFGASSRVHRRGNHQSAAT